MGGALKYSMLVAGHSLFPCSHDLPSPFLTYLCLQQSFLLLVSILPVLAPSPPLSCDLPDLLSPHGHSPLPGHPGNFSDTLFSTLSYIKCVECVPKVRDWLPEICSVPSKQLTQGRSWYLLNIELTYKSLRESRDEHFHCTWRSGWGGAQVPTQVRESQE